MGGRLQVEIAPEQGFALLGGARVSLAPFRNGSYLVEGSAEVRAISFAERGSLLLEAMGRDDVCDALISLVADRSILRPGKASPDTLRAVTLALAGGGHEEWS